MRGRSTSAARYPLAWTAIVALSLYLPVLGLAREASDDELAPTPLRVSFNYAWRFLRTTEKGFPSCRFERPLQAGAGCNGGCVTPWYHTLVFC